MKKFIIFILSLLFTLTTWVNGKEICFADNEMDYTIKGYAGTGSFSLYINGEDKLYSVGENGAGQLGIGTTKAHFDPQYVTDGVLQVAVSGDLSAYAIKQDGLYAWGKNQYGQLGLGGEYNTDAKTNYKDAPQKVNIPFTVKQISCGKSFTVLLSTTGAVYAAGSNRFGQLGLPSTYAKDSIFSTFTAVTAVADKTITDIATADFTTYVLTEDGEVYSFGDNNYGELGIGSDEKHPNNSQANKVVFDKKVVKISAGGSNAMALTEDGKAYIWGSNNNNQLGQPGSSALAPIEVAGYSDFNGNPSEVTAVDIFCAGVNNFVLSSEGAIYAFGINSDGNCGINNEGSKVTNPTKIDFFKPLNLEEMKKNGESQVVLSANPVDLTTPENVTIKEFLGGCASRIFIKDSNDVTWSFGNNSSSQLCSGNTAKSFVPVKSTLFRIEKYDGEYVPVDYLTKPIIFLCVVFALLIVFLVFQEIKIRKIGKDE